MDKEKCKDCFALQHDDMCTASMCIKEYDYDPELRLWTPKEKADKKKPIRTITRMEKLGLTYEEIRWEVNKKLIIAGITGLLFKMKYYIKKWSDKNDLLFRRI